MKEREGGREGGRKSYACMSVLLLDNNAMSASEMSFCDQFLENTFFELQCTWSPKG